MVKKPRLTPPATTAHRSTVTMGGSAGEGRLPPALFEFENQKQKQQPGENIWYSCFDPPITFRGAFRYV
jgi:hypothetical protein